MKYLQPDLTQFVHDRFGLFIHWGIYAMWGKGEWCLRDDRIPQEQYQFLIDHFAPDLFDPSQWAQRARAAGMKYVIIVTKHHDGFCMWDTQYTDYKVTNSACGRDLLAEIVAAFRAEGLRIGLYYSISDWHHPDYLITKRGNHALDNLPEEKIAELNSTRDMSRYALYMRNQVRELLTNFGEICEFWFDVSGKIDPVACECAQTVQMIQELQPHVILNGRHSIPEATHILTPEGYLREEDCVDEQGHPNTWEGCHCLTAAWCYRRDEKSYFKTPFRCLEILITQTSLNGNTLMNIGPTSRGYLSDREKQLLDYYAHWMRLNGRSIYGCGAAPSWIAPPPRDCRYTHNKATNRLYIHLMRWPDISRLVLRGLRGKIRYAQLLCDGTCLQIIDPKTMPIEPINPRVPEDAAALQLMSAPENMPIPVIECFLES